ncbi:hypothetical protein [Leifsonia sp. EB34]|uniref:hypothetical protein n=1 Tax=Leifsonia sp. EB34 TaxID=3156303 RepID=UPI0035174EB2
MTETADSAEVRWRAADRLAEGATDDRMGRRRSRLLTWVVGLLVVSWLIGFALAILLPRPSYRGSGGGIGGIAELVLVVLGILVGLAGFIWGRRTGHYVPRWRAVMSPLNRAERKAVMKQIRGKQTLDTEHAATIIAAGQQARRATLGLVPIYTGAVLMTIGIALNTTSTLALILFIVAIACYLGAAIALLINYRQIGAFLRQHRGRPDNAGRS